MNQTEYMDKLNHRQEYRHIWHTDLMRTLPTDPAYFCFSMFCAPCASFMLRKRALYNDMSRYMCCAGYMPCSGHCGESRCPTFCLATEACCCFGNSVASTRFLLQDEFNIQTTQCDNCIIGCMLCLQQLACIFSIIAMIAGSDELSEASQMLNLIADLVYCSVCTCMQTQHKIEMDKRDGLFKQHPMTVPPAQEMSRMEQPYPTEYPQQTPPGYPPHQPYYVSPPPGMQPPPPGYPGSQQGYPPHPPPYPQNYPAQGYPAGGYPPSRYPPADLPPK